MNRGSGNAGSSPLFVVDVKSLPNSDIGLANPILDGLTLAWGVDPGIRRTGYGGCKLLALQQLVGLGCFPMGPWDVQTSPSGSFW